MKYAVVHGGTSKVIEARDEATAIKEFMKERVATTAWMYGDSLKSSFTGSLWVHEMDDGTEYKVSGELKISITDVSPKEILPEADEFDVDQVSGKVAVKKR